MSVFEVRNFRKFFLALRGDLLALQSLEYWEFSSFQVAVVSSWGLVLQSGQMFRSTRFLWSPNDYSQQSAARGTWCWVQKSYRSTRAYRILMSDTSLNLLRFLSIQSRRSSKVSFCLLYSVLEIFIVTKRLATSSVPNVMGMRIIASRFSVTRNLTCKGLPSGIQKIVVIKCPLARKVVSTYSECQLSNASCFHQVDLK